MAFFKRRPQTRPMEVLFYRDYIHSQAWELRKKQYYAKYKKECAICGDMTGVELNHLKYGNYGRERDRDLAPLCADHHKALHHRIAHGDMHYQTMQFLREEIAKHGVRSESKAPEPLTYNYSPSIVLSIQTTLDVIARPIWRFYQGVFRW